MSRRMMRPSFPRPELEEAMIHSIKVFNSLTPEQKREHREAQRRSWVVGETMLENPNITRQEADALYDRVILGEPDPVVLEPRT